VVYDSEELTGLEDSSEEGSDDELDELIDKSRIKIT
jgi:hypothetical protein